MVGHGTKGDVHAGSNRLVHMCDTFGGLRVDKKPKSATFGYRLLEFQKNRMGGVADPVVLDLDRQRGGRLVEADDVSPDGDDD